MCRGVQSGPPCVVLIYTALFLLSYNLQKPGRARTNMAASPHSHWAQVRWRRRVAGYRDGSFGLLAPVLEASPTGDAAVLF